MIPQLYLALNNFDQAHCATDADRETGTRNHAGRDESMRGERGRQNRTCPTMVSTKSRTTSRFSISRCPYSKPISVDIQLNHITQHIHASHPTSHRSCAPPALRRPVISEPRLSAATQNRLPAWRGPDPPWYGKYVRLRKDWAAGDMRVGLGECEVVAVMYLTWMGFVWECG
jgi:hypothetical protein